MQGKSFCALLFGHRSVLRQDRFVSQKSFDEFDAVCGVICHGPSSPGAIYTHSKTNKERDSSSSSSMCQSEIVDSPGGADGQATEQQRENQAKRKLQGAGASVGIIATACVRVMDIYMHGYQLLSFICKKLILLAAKLWKFFPTPTTSIRSNRY